ncbi:hypothetical protein BGZ76_009788 [Entomortierella beljakovae]|nr:hypothetical protein BGZ76_009788 [Entomortierella beljakovae]
MSNDVYSKISERMKQEQFTEEEIRIVGRAKEQLSSYVRAKNLKGIPAAAIAAGGFLVGGQIGLLLGAMSSIKTIQSIPNFQRVLNIVQEVREETTGQTGQRVQPQHDRAPSFPPTGYQRPPIQSGRSELISDDMVDQQNQNFEGFKNGDGYHGGNDPNGSSKIEQSSAWSHASERAKEIQSNSASWGQIRNKTLPKSAWDGVRDGNIGSKSASSDKDDDSANSSSNDNRNINKVTGWDRVRLGDREGSLNGGAGYDGPSDFARTREDFESKPRQRNQYGDTI